MAALGCGGMDLRGEGEAQGPRGERGRVGDGIEEARAWLPYLLPASMPVRRSGGDAPLFRPWSGEQERGESDRGNGPGRPDGPGGPAWLRAGPSGPGGSFSFLFVLLCLIFSFSVLANCLGTK